MNVNRRKAVIVGGTVITGSLFGLSKAQSTSAQTDIVLESFNVPDTTQSVKQVQSVPISVKLKAEWESTGADTLEVDLFAGLSENSATKISTEQFTISQTGSDIFQLTGDILTSADIDRSMVDPTIGASVTLSIGVQTTLKGDSKALDTSELWDTAELTVNDDVIEGTLETGATGNITVVGSQQE